MCTPFLLLMALPAAPVAAQDLQILVQEGDPTPDGFVVQFQNEILVGTGASWVAAINTTNPNTGVDDYAYRDGSVLIAPGDPIPGLPGDTVDFFRGLAHASSDLTAYTVQATNAGDDVVVLEDNLIAQEGELVPAYLGLPAGTTWFRLEDLHLEANGRLGVPAVVEIPGVPSTTRIFAVFDTDASHQAVGGSVAHQQGMTLSNGQTAMFVFNGGHEASMNSAGDVIWWGSTGAAGFAAINDVVIAEESMPTPEPGLNWSTFTGPEVDLNDSGDWVIRGRVAALPRDVVMASSGLIARQGQPHPAYPAFTARDFGLNAPVYVANDGTVAFYVELNGTSGEDVNEAYVVGDQMVVREGVTQVGGMTIVDISDGRDGFHFASDGSSMIFEGDLDDNGTIRETNFLVTFGPGQAYCIAELNSTGSPAAIAASGSSSAAVNDLSLVASALPTGSFGFFLVSQTQGFTALAGGSQGNLCLAGSIGRYQNQAMSSGATGSIGITVDLTAVAGPTGPYPGTPGMTLNFQAWYRDANPSITSNFTNGVSVTLQ